MILRTIALACLFPLSALAQDPTAAPPAATKAVGTPPVTVTLAFGGGTLADFCAQIRQKEPRANIVVAPLAAGAKLPAMDLRSAGLEQALEGACAIAESTALIRMQDFRGPGEPVFTIMAQEPVVTIGKTGPNGPVTTGTMPASLPRTEGTEVVSINRLIDAKDGTGFSVTTVLSAIEAATGEQALASLRFHKESGLLIVRGRPDQLALVRDVLSSLESDVKERRKQDNARKGIPNDPTKESK